MKSFVGKANTAHLRMTRDNELIHCIIMTRDNELIYCIIMTRDNEPMNCHTELLLVILRRSRRISKCTIFNHRLNKEGNEIILKGIFIALEGPDGSGKSTIMKLITNYFKEKNIEFISTREPGGTPIGGEEIRHIILDKKNHNMSAETEALLYAASRGQHVYEKLFQL